MGDTTGAQPADVVKAAFLARDGFDLPRLWAQTDALDGTLPGEAQNGLYARISDIFADATRLILQTKAGQGEIEAAITALKGGARKLRSTIPGLALRDRSEESRTGKACVST